MLMDPNYPDYYRERALRDIARIRRRAPHVATANLQQIANDLR